MEQLLPVIKNAMVNGLVDQAVHRDNRKSLAGLALAVLAGLVFFLAVVFAALGGYHFLIVLYSPPIAYMIIGAVLLVLCGAILFWAQHILKKESRKVSAHSREELTQLVTVIIDGFSHDLAEPVRHNPKTAMAAAAIAGYLAGGKML